MAFVWSDQFRRFVSDHGPEHFRTFSTRAPLSTHWRPSNCQEFECDDFVYGYVLTIDTSTEQGQAQFDYLTHDKTRKYSYQKVGATEYKFVYGPGNDGMGLKHAEHRVPIGRPPLLLVAEGDFRGNPRGIPTRRHTRPEFWVEEFALHQNKLAERINRG